MNFRHAIRTLLPHGIVEWHWQKERARQAQLYRQKMQTRDMRRTETWGQIAQDQKRQFNYADALEFLDGLKIDPFHIRDGSMPHLALAFMESHFDRLDPMRPLFGLHVGNFLGVSLAYLADALAKLHPDSKIVSIDPNIPHRGVARPSEAAIALLASFGLEDRVAVLQGYSMEKSISNDGETFSGYDPVANWRAEHACTEQLALLATLCPERFDLCLMDGNHDASYLRRELDQVHRLLRPGGLLVLDDVSEPWPEILSVFSGIAADRFEKLGANGRIGILAKR